MYYSLTFIDPIYNDKGVYQPDPDSAVRKSYNLTRTRNTWDHWRVVPTSRPSFAPPSINTREVSIAGMNGVLDLSQALTGYPTYGNRTGSIDFAVLNDFRNWQEAYSDILATIHGKKLFCVYEEDPEWYYVGRWEVQSWTTGKTRSTLTLKYNLEPYKYRLYDILGNWLWDPFNFQSGIISQRIGTNGGWNPYHHRVDLDISEDNWNSVIDTSNEAFFGEEHEEDGTYHGYFYRRNFVTDSIGSMPVSLELHLHPDDNTEMHVQYKNVELGLGHDEDHGEHDTYNGVIDKVIYPYVISNFTGINRVKIRVRGHGYVSVNFKPGRI